MKQSKDIIIIHDENQLNLKKTSDYPFLNWL